MIEQKLLPHPLITFTTRVRNFLRAVNTTPELTGRERIAHKIMANDEHERDAISSPVE